MPDCLVLDTEACRKDDPALHDVSDCCQPPHHIGIAADFHNHIESGQRAISLLDQYRYHDMLLASCSGSATRELCRSPRWWSRADKLCATASAICRRQRAAIPPRSAYD